MHTPKHAAQHTAQQPARHHAKHARTHPRKRTRRTILTAITITTLTVSASLYTHAVTTAPLPNPTITPNPALPDTLPDKNTQQTLQNKAQQLVNNYTQPTAIGWLENNKTWTNSNKPWPLGSITKLVTVLVTLEKQPLKPGQNGPTHHWTTTDNQRSKQYAAEGGVTYPIPTGTPITVRQMLKLIFLPSANDHAAAYTYSVWKNNTNYLNAVQNWKQRHNLKTLHIEEPTGMNQNNTATPNELLQITRIALKNPTLREYMKMKTQTMPWGIGEIHSTNLLLGEEPNIIGVKTGMSYAGGWNFIAAKQTTTNGRTLTPITITLGRPTKQARKQAGQETLQKTEQLPTQTQLLPAHQHIATITTPWGSKTQLITSHNTQTTLLPGETWQLTDTQTPPPPHCHKPTKHKPTLTLKRPDNTQQKIALHYTNCITEPGLLWRLTHPTQLLH